jgi:L-asparaginase / beta-aspartyl-peptidase
MSNFTLAIHGGAGTIDKSIITPELEAQYLQGLQQALNAGNSILAANGSAMQAVQAAVMHLEDNILFNAGKGSVFTKTGTHEMDAAIMDGATLQAGAVSGVTGVRNPIALCSKIITDSGHVLLSGQGALEFAQQCNIPIEAPEYFHSDFRYQQWQQVKETDGYQLDHNIKTPTALNENKFGTVGAVALDVHGNIAAATSTGGMTNKQYGRIGDSPIIGSGTYANNNTCAVSCTGHGEYFIRSVVAYDVSCLMAYKDLSLAEACQVVVMDKLVKIGGEGGLIALDAQGNYELCFNSDGMYRGVCNSKGLNYVGIYK